MWILMQKPVLSALFASAEKASSRKSLCTVRAEGVKLGFPATLRDIAHQREYLDRLGAELGFLKREDWYRATRADFIRHSGKALMRLYNNSLPRLLSTVYSDFQFLPWLFSRVAHGYWKSRDNRNSYIQWLLGRTGIQDPSNLSQRDFMEHRGAGLLMTYKGSPQKVVESISGAFDTESASVRGKTPQRFWNSVENQRSYLDRIGAKLGVRGTDLSPWYNVSWYNESSQTLPDVKIKTLLTHYNGSTFHMLAAVYPEFDWKPWKFQRLPNGISTNQRWINEILTHAEQALNISSPEGWYRVTNVQLKRLRLEPFVKANGGLFNLLKIHRPNFHWKESEFTGVYFFPESLLGALLRSIWLDKEVLGMHSLDPSTKVSYFIPSAKLALDFQADKYYGLRSASGKVSVQLKADEDKIKSAQRHGISILFIPFWWDRSIGSLTASIIDRRPDLREFVELALRSNGACISVPIPNETTLSLSQWRRRNDFN